MTDIEKAKSSSAPSEAPDSAAASLRHIPSSPAVRDSAPLEKTTSRRTLKKTLSKASKRDEALADPHNERSIHGWRWVVVVLIVCTSAFLYGLDTTIAANIQGPAVETFGQVDKLAWIGTGFPLGSVAVILSVGKAYGIFNMKWLYVASMIMFEAGSALCGGAPNMSTLIVGRVWAGIGGAGIYLGGLNLISVFTSLRERSTYIGLISISWGVGCILGPVIGGAFADSSASWRWAFYINLVIFGATAPIIVLFLPSFDPKPDLSYWQKQSHLDWLGSLLNAATYATLVIALTFGGAQWRWASPGFIVSIVLCAVSLIAFGVQQRIKILTSQEWRIFPVDFLSNFQLILHYILTSTAACAAFIALYYIPVFFEFAHGDNGITTAVRLLPFICMFIFFCMFNGTLMPVFGWYMPWYAVSEVLILIGGALMYALVDFDTNTSTVYGCSVLIGIGAGLAAQASYSVVPAKVDPLRVPDAIGFINSAQIGSIVISLAISGTVFQNLAYKHVSEVLAGTDFTSADIHAALAGARSSVFTKSTPELRMQVLEGIVNAISNIYILIVAAGAFGLICSLLLKREKLFMTMSAGG